MLDFMIDNKYVLLTGRVLLVIVYLYLNPFLTWDFLANGLHPVATAAVKGIPAFLVWASMALKLFAGFAIIIGFQTRLGALALIVFTLCTAFIFHFPTEPDMNYVVFLKEISMIGGLLILAAVGPGELSVEGRKKS